MVTTPLLVNHVTKKGLVGRGLRFTNPEIYIPQDSTSRRRRIFDDPWGGGVQGAHWRLHKSQQAPLLGLDPWPFSVRGKPMNRWTSLPLKSYLLITVFKKRNTVKLSFHWGIHNATKFNMHFYLLSWTIIKQHWTLISNLIMSNILEEDEKSRLIYVFQAFAMNIYESLLTCLWKSDEFRWICTKVVWIRCDQL